MASPIQQLLNRISDSLRTKEFPIPKGSFRPPTCPNCGATSPSDLLVRKKGIIDTKDRHGNITHTITDIICLSNWHTHYPEKPTVIVESNHPE